MVYACLVNHLERFLLELGAGFAFVGRQVHLDVAEEDFYIDLLFYHLGLRSFVVVDLKIGPFKPEYAGKINFYCNVVDDKYRHTTDNPTIGLIFLLFPSKGWLIKKICNFNFKEMCKERSCQSYKKAFFIAKKTQSTLLENVPRIR